MNYKDKIEFIELAKRNVDERATSYCILTHGLDAFKTTRKCLKRFSEQRLAQSHLGKLETG